MPQCRAEVTSKAARQRALGASCRDRHAAAGQGQKRRFVNFVDGRVPIGGPGDGGKIDQVETLTILPRGRLRHGEFAQGPNGLGSSIDRIRGTNRVQSAAGRVQGRLLESALMQDSLPRGRTGKGGFLFWLVLPPAGDRPAGSAAILAGAAGTRRPVRCVKLAFQWQRTPAGSPRCTGLFAASDDSPSFAWEVEPAQPKGGTGPLRDVGVSGSRAPSCYPRRRAGLLHTIVRPSRAASTRRRAPACRTRVRACFVRAAMRASS